jgi:hypothetical protein
MGCFGSKDDDMVMVKRMLRCSKDAEVLKRC